MTHILVLAGTAEARQLLSMLKEDPRLRVTASLAGATRDPADLGVSTRTGGFGGADGLAAWLGKHEIGMVVDATHPFAARMPLNTVRACQTASVPRLRLLRPEWPSRPEWRQVTDIEMAAAALPVGASVLLTTGRNELRPFIQRADVTFYARSIDPVDGLPPHINNLTARPPFTISDEIALMRRLGVDHLVSKNAGGAGTAKLDAAEVLRLTTMMIDRPAPPPGDIAASPDDAVAWIDRIVAKAK